MTGFEVYKMYLALKQHFTKSDYDYFKYRGRSVPMRIHLNKDVTVISLKN